MMKAPAAAEKAIPFAGDVPLVLINQTDATVRDFMIVEGKNRYVGKRRANIVASGNYTSNYKQAGTPIPGGDGPRFASRRAPTPSS
jgi:hypothetical protein